LYIFFRPVRFGHQALVNSARGGGASSPKVAEELLRMLASGTVLQNRYRVERQIGEGGMGAVYVATDERFGSTVALKETFFSDPGLRKAFEREARLLNHLRHPALPRVSDHFTEDEGQFLVMEYIQGEDLSDMLKARGAPFHAVQVLGWADQLLDALEYLHTQQPPVIHRDIKPQNIKLLPRDQVVLLDFGLAKGAPLQTRVTATGSVFGYSFNYAPIEQMQGAGTDTRSDLYSLAATLYHLLTATTPADALTRATAVLNGEADPLRSAHEVCAGVNIPVSEVLSRALSQSAARRFASAAEMRAALREAAQKIAPGAEAATPAGASVQTNAASRTTPAREQEGRSESETRLMYPPNTNRLPLAETEELLEETAVTPAHDAATLAGTQAAGTREREGNQTREREGKGTGAVTGETANAAADVATDAAADAFEGERTSASVGARASSSEGGRASSSEGVRASSAAGRHTSSPAPAAEWSAAKSFRATQGTDGAGKGRRRAFVAALCAVAVALAAVVVYSLAHRAPQTDAGVQVPAGQPTPQPQAAEPQAQPTAESAGPAQVPTANASAHNAPPRRDANASEKNAKPREENQSRPAETTTPPAVPTPAPPQRAGQAEEENPFRNRDMTRNPPTDEEIRVWLQQHPGWLEQHPNRARMLRRRLMQDERRRRNNQPIPPQQPQP
jgi:predicted Ser/Thr protein kinase